MKWILILLLSLTLNQLFTQAQDLKVQTERQLIDLQKYFEPNRGSFVITNLKNNKTSVYNDSVSSERYPPCSTFKITNSLISLQSGIAKDANCKILYDSLRNPPKAWWHKAVPFKYWMQDHTMKTAIKNSVVWYYQELARRIGEDDMMRLLKQIDYGNNNISSGIDNFWLCGSLTISAYEQINFLKKLYTKQLTGFSDESQEIVKEIMLNESTENYKLYGKTGGGDCWNNQVIGWYVGFVETKSDTYIFAMNIFLKDFKGLGNKRIEITKQVLKDLKIIE